MTFDFQKFTPGPDVIAEARKALGADHLTILSTLDWDLMWSAIEAAGLNFTIPANVFIFPDEVDVWDYLP